MPVNPWLTKGSKHLFDSSTAKLSPNANVSLHPNTSSAPSFLGKRNVKDVFIHASSAGKQLDDEQHIIAFNNRLCTLCSNLDNICIEDGELVDPRVFTGFQTVGFDNEGNNCYQNSVFQVLLMRADSIVSSPLPSLRTLSEETQRVFRASGQSLCSFPDSLFADTLRDAKRCIWVGWFFTGVRSPPRTERSYCNQELHVCRGTVRLPRVLPLLDLRIRRRVSERVPEANIVNRLRMGGDWKWRKTFGTHRGENGRLHNQQHFRDDTPKAGFCWFTEWRVAKHLLSETENGGTVLCDSFLADCGSWRSCFFFRSS